MGCSTHSWLDWHWCGRALRHWLPLVVAVGCRAARGSAPRHRGLLTKPSRILVGGGISVVALGLFVVFAAGVRHFVPTSKKLTGDIALAGAIVTTTAGLAAETINMGGAVRAGSDPRLAQAMYEIPQVFGGYTSAVGVGIFAMAVAASNL